MEFREIVLLLCGNFNPITNMHLRMFEIAKDHLSDIGFSVYKGLISPFEKNVNDSHIISIEHRIAMIKYALNSSSWIQLSSWHCEKFDLATVSTMLQHHQSRLEFLFRSSLTESNINKFNTKNCRFIVKLLCGADVFLCLKNANAVNELHNILKNHGIVVISRAGFDVENIIYDDDVLWMHRKNIFVVKNGIENQISSRRIRQAVARKRSIKYLVNDAVERYICLHDLYTISNTEYQEQFDFNKTDTTSSCETSDSFREYDCCSNCDCGSSTETLTNTLHKKSKLLVSYKNRCRPESHFRNIDKSKLIGIPVTEDGVIQIIADKETNL